MTDTADRVAARNQLCNANEFPIPLCSLLPLYIYLSFFLFSFPQPCAAFPTGGTSLFGSSEDKQMLLSSLQNKRKWYYNLDCHPTFMSSRKACQRSNYCQYEKAIFKGKIHPKTLKRQKNSYWECMLVYIVSYFWGITSQM